MITWAQHVEMETEGWRSPAQVEQQFTPEQVREVERMSAADLMLAMRRVDELCRTWPEPMREAYLRRFEGLAHEFSKAAERLRQLRPDGDYIPPFLRADVRLIARAELENMTQIPPGTRMPCSGTAFSIIRGLRR